MKCGWGCGAQLTGRNMRAHFTICPKRPAVSEDGDRRGRRVELETAKGLNFATRQARRNLSFDDARTSRQPSGPFQNGSFYAPPAGLVLRHLKHSPLLIAPRAQRAGARGPVWDRSRCCCYAWRRVLPPKPTLLLLGSPRGPQRLRRLCGPWGLAAFSLLDRLNERICLRALGKLA